MATTATTKPKRVWKPPAKSADGAAGVPSLFASASLKKPLKVNKTVVSTVRSSKRPSSSTTSTTTSSATATATSKPTKPTPTSTTASSSSAAPSPAPAAEVAVTKPKEPAPEPKPKPAEVTKSEPSLPSKPATVTSSARVNSSGAGPKTLAKNGRIIRNEASKAMPSVVGTPRSWPKPHAVPANEKPIIKPPKNKEKQISAKKGPKLDNSETNFNYEPEEELIPEMYRRKSAKEIEREQREEIDKFRQAMYELRMEQRAKEEQALQPKDVTGSISNVMEMLHQTKQMNSIEVDSDIGSGSEHEPASSNAYAKHMESKLAYFKDVSTHSVDISVNSDDWNSDSSDDDDDDSSTSWDDDDNLFRG